MIETIILMIIILLFIDYYHKQYRIKLSQKKIIYRNSHSFYDDTDYSKYKPYKEIYTYKILIIFLLIILIYYLIFFENINILIYIIKFTTNFLIPDNWIDITIMITITIIIFFKMQKNNYNKKNNLSIILIYLIYYFILLTLSDLIYH